MPLSIGTRLGSYEILSALGAGGMGEVYRHEAGSRRRDQGPAREGYFTSLNWWGRSYDISPDGQRFLMIKEGGGDGTGASIVVVQHWVEELKRLVPTK